MDIGDFTRRDEKVAFAACIRLFFQSYNASRKLLHTVPAKEAAFDAYFGQLMHEQNPI
ncbi:hypothetical protein C7460_1252 [Marinoscillum furvescens DSM 4134]|uniref:Uncharacterized protein n=1 Tax=Marinoscillum furvescens DSM 4134 TaxID=1122208 RepID=A0A3D9KXJ0_MARFU|nr:hypothetical protein C7460_1252 [Marinoscillum furvescens DSM 4134]